MGLPYNLTDRIGSRATLGLIVLQSDETIEQDFRRIFRAGDIALYISRVPSGAEVTTDTLGAMEAELPRSAGLLPPSLDFDAIGYACTSGATVIGPERVGALIGAARQTRAVTNPLTATLAALTAVGARRVGLVSPYIASVSGPLRGALGAAGFEVSASVSFDELEEARVARIDPASIRDAALAVGGADVDAVFLSCTNLRTLDILDGLEAALGKPVISSNQALAWHMGQLAGLATLDGSFGSLMRGADRQGAVTVGGADASDEHILEPEKQ